jgi:hypothetical protein
MKSLLTLAIAAAMSLSISGAFAQHFDHRNHGEMHSHRGHFGHGARGHQHHFASHHHHSGFGHHGHR